MIVTNFQSPRILSEVHLCAIASHHSLYTKISNEMTHVFDLNRAVGATFDTLHFIEGLPLRRAGI